MTVQVQPGPIERRHTSTLDTGAARSLLGLPDVPTVVAIGPFDDREHTDQLAGALAALRLRCEAQLVFLGGEVDGGRWPTGGRAGETRDRAAGRSRQRWIRLPTR